MILRDSQHPKGLDCGDAQNLFRVRGGGLASRDRYKSRIAQALFCPPARRGPDPRYLALAAAQIRQAIADAQQGIISPTELDQVGAAYRLAHGIDVGTPVLRSDIRDWLRREAAAWLADQGIAADRAQLDAAYSGLMTSLRHEPEAA
jgi:hypothetical protein